MKKLLSIILLAAVALTVFGGCGADPLQDDLINYINNQIPALTKLENTVASEYSAVTSDEKTTDAEFAEKLEDVIIPAEDELIKKAKAIVPATEELNELHTKYINSLSIQREGLDLMLEAAQTSDKSLLASAEEKIEEAEALSSQYLSELTALKMRHGVADATEQG